MEGEYFGEYDIAEICLNGHTSNSEVRRYPERNKKFCDKCGSPTIANCPNCQVPIRGLYYHPMVSSGSFYTPPSFCHNCGKPYPWTEARLKAAQELTDEQANLTKEEKELLKKSLDDLVRETPQTTVAASRFKRLVAKAGAGAAGAFRDLLVDVLSETAKKIIWPPGAS